MKILVLSSLVGLMLTCYQSTAQTNVHLNNCPWISHSVTQGPDGLPVDNYETEAGPDGYYLFYSDETESVLIMEGELENGQRQGEWKFYNNNGTLYCRCHYVNGLLNGLYELFNHDGLVSESIEMLNDLPVENHSKTKL
ncbi:MAG: toxin-antitoxin system YwqK family antitoxin [Bacteroidales bacterium]